MKIIRFRRGYATLYSMRSSLLIWLLIVLAVFSFGLLKQFLLADKFYFDSGNILRRIDFASLSVGDSYSNSAYLYSLIGMADNGLLFSVISTSIFIWFCLFHIGRIYPARVSIIHIPLMAFLLVLGCAYLTVVSKEFIVLLLMGIFFWAFRSGSVIFRVLWIGIALLYGFYFREYWLGVVGLFLAIRYIFYRRWFFLLAPCILIFWVALDMALRQKYGWSLSEYRFTINDGRESDPNSMTIITNLLPSGGPINSLVNAIWSWLILMIPVDLIALGTVYHFFLFLMLSWLSWRFLKSFRAFMDSSARSPYVIDAYAIVIAYFCTLAPLEPDHGSGVKHLAPFFPLLFMLLFRVEQVKYRLPQKQWAVRRSTRWRAQTPSD